MADPNTIELGRIGYSTIYSIQDEGPAFFYQAGMAIDADGAFRAYHPDGQSGLDYLANAGKPGNWWALVTDKNGNPLIQGPNDPAPGFYISTTSLQDRTKKKKDPRRYVDSSTIPFIVLPGNAKFTAVLSDFCMVYNPVNQQLSGGVFADTGPKGQIGEASIAMAGALGINSDPRHGGVGYGIFYLVFPGSSTGWPLDNAAIQQGANAAFDAWGGLDKLEPLINGIV